MVPEILILDQGTPNASYRLIVPLVSSWYLHMLTHFLDFALDVTIPSSEMEDLYIFSTFEVCPWVALRKVYRFSKIRVF